MKEKKNDTADEIIAVDRRFNKINLFESILGKHFQSHKVWYNL